MIQITFIEPDGAEKCIEADDGQTLMQAAIGHGIRGVIAECGGAQVCGTCHCHVDAPWRSATGTPGDDERMLLEFSEHHGPGSRLSCQIRVSPAVDGMRVRIPPSQP